MEGGVRVVREGSNRRQGLWHKDIGRRRAATRGGMSSAHPHVKRAVHSARSLPLLYKSGHSHR